MSVFQSRLDKVRMGRYRVGDDQSWVPPQYDELHFKREGPPGSSSFAPTPGIEIEEHRTEKIPGTNCLAGRNFEEMF